jgi:phosphomannomutase
MSIFKAYDIRGVVPDQLREEDAHRIGGAVAQHLGGPALAVGRDARSTSPELGDAVVRGITEAGVDVIDLGLVATPMLYFGVDRLGTAGGVMVTASHNPAEYNGFKVCGPNAVPVSEVSGLREIEQLAAREPERANVLGRVRQENVREPYVEQMLGLLEGTPKAHVALDCGNGMAGVGLERLLERLPITTERLYFEPDCTFPNHPADPLDVANLADLVDAVRRTGADFGVAFDGDGDRAVFVDEKAEPVSSDLVTGLLARSILQRQPGGRILYDLRSSRATAEEVAAAGGVPEMCRVGHSFIKAQMRESGAVFAGELSGHFYFRFSDTLVADDGTAAFVAMLELLRREARPLSELVAPLQRYSASGEISRRIPDPSAFLRDIESEHSEAEISHLDGLLVRYADWWFNLRASNTEPVVRLNLEADDSDQMARERDRLVARMDAAGA